MSIWDAFAVLHAYIYSMLPSRSLYACHSLLSTKSLPAVAHDFMMYRLLAQLHAYMQSLALLLVSPFVAVQLAVLPPQIELAIMSTVYIFALHS